jgi:hypothetical protein
MEVAKGEGEGGSTDVRGGNELCASVAFVLGSARGRAWQRAAGGTRWRMEMMRGRRNRCDPSFFFGGMTFALIGP